MNYLFPFELVQVNAKVVLYGSGEAGYDFYRQVITGGYCELVAWVDRQYEWYQYLDLSVTSPESVDWKGVDAVVIAVTNPKHFLKIREDLLAQGVSADCLIWKENYKLKEVPFARMDERRRSQEVKRAKQIHPKELITEKRLDILVRYLYAKELLQGEKAGEGCRLYTKFFEILGTQEPVSNKVFAFFSDYEQKQGITTYREAFWNLLQSMTKTGFQKKYFIPLDRYGRAVNGAHRIAAGLALGLWVWVVDFLLFEGLDFDFSAEWMLKNGFEKNDVEKLLFCMEEIQCEKRYQSCLQQTMPIL